MTDKRFYEAHRTELIEKSKQRYQEKREEILAKQNERKKEYKKAQKENAEKGEILNLDTDRMYRKSVKVNKPSYMQVKTYPNGIIIIEAEVSPKQYDDMSITDKEGMRNKRRLENTLNNINTANNIVIVEHNEVQVYLKSENNIQEIVDSVSAFIEEFHKAKEQRIASNNVKAAKPVLQFSIGGEYMAEYESISEAARISDTPRQRITSCLIGKAREAGGYIWKWKYEE